MDFSRLMILRAHKGFGYYCRCFLLQDLREALGAGLQHRRQTLGHLAVSPKAESRCPRRL